MDLTSKLITIWVQIRDLYLYVFRNALILNAYVDDHTWRGIRHRNWGDDLNYYLLSILSGRPVVIYQNFWLARKLKRKNYLCIGTLLDAVNYSNHATVVWGSGVSGQERDFVHPQHICSVRGRKTYEFLKTHGVACPERFGDPALILPRVYKPVQIHKKYRLGIIPHVIDLHYSAIEEIRRTRPDILIIDLGHYIKWTDVIDQICSCEAVASSSLHGLIVSDAYGVPNCWITLSGKISGGLFKFYDYFSSIGRTETKPFQITVASDIDRVDDLLVQWMPAAFDVDDIVEACPFLNDKQRMLCR